MSELLQSAIDSVQSSSVAYCRFITANDTGTTGAHQAGFYIPKCAAPLFFDEPGVKGENKDKFVSIKWQGDFTTDSRMIYYGRGTRNEYRITRFGKDFPFLSDDNVGNLMVLAQKSPEDYEAFVLSADDDIDDFLLRFNLSIDDTNQLIDLHGTKHPDARFADLIAGFVASCSEFPDTRTMSAFARKAYDEAHGVSSSAPVKNPDSILQQWISAEYQLFRAVEQKVHADICSHPFKDLDQFIAVANSILNKRKSRAGKSLEHHLSSIFSANHLWFEEQVVTEGHKKPDFVFPNGKCYHHFEFPTDKLTVLGAKTTCKDRWRQVATEADRADFKYLFTTQPGLTIYQLREMEALKVGVVTPEKNIGAFPSEFQPKIHSLAKFIGMVKEQQTTIPAQFLSLL